jgi:hypothetical protein
MARWLARSVLVVPVALLLAPALPSCAPEPATPSYDFDSDGTTDDRDCAPADPAIYVGAVDPWGDGIDQDCDGIDGRDLDGDGAAGDAFPEDLAVPQWDCDDDDPALNRQDLDGDGSDTCEGDCDDQDDDVEALDLDGDGATTCDGDCDDGDGLRFPGADEGCDQLDNDCDGALGTLEDDADSDGAAECEGDCDDADTGLNLRDFDQDGVTSCAGDCDDFDPALNLADADGDGASSCQGDCDDADAARFPGADEGCDRADTDCDGALSPLEHDGDSDGAAECEGDCDDADTGLNLRDFDQDGASTCAGDCADFDPSMNPADADGDGASTCDGDCDDGDDTRFPGAPEGCDGIDTDCDGLPTPEEADADQDGFASCEGDCDDANDTLEPADADADGVSTCEGDCDDDEGTRYPGAPEGCDGLDQDCDGLPAPEEADADQDGYAACEGDCDDANDTLEPADLDGDGVTTCAGDCDDTVATAAPGLPEVCDQADSDCDFVLPAAEADADGDGWAPCQQDCDDTDPTLVPVDTDLDGFSTCDGDCAGDDPSVGPGAADSWGDGIDQDCDGGDGLDADGDGFSPEAVPAAYSNPLWDCVDTDAAMNPADSDGDGWSSCEGDCDDADPAVTPEIWGDPTNGPDSDCDAFGATSLSAAWAVLVGEDAGDEAGGDLTALRDMDGDGLDDLALGAAAWGPSNHGKAYVATAIQLSVAGPQDLAGAYLRVSGVYADDNWGTGIAGGDTDGDGFGDLLVVSPLADVGFAGCHASTVGDGGLASVLVATQVAGGGAMSWWSSRLLWPGFGPPNSNFGSSAAVAELDGDGLGDVVVGSPAWDVAGTDSGSVLATSGTATASTATVRCSSSGDRVSTHGAAPGDQFGYAVSSAGDIDEDGLEDLLASAPYNDAGGGDAGAVYLLLGETVAAGPTPISSLSQWHATVLGELGGDRLGQSLGSAGDVDGDGAPDAILGAPGRDCAAGPDCGAAYLLLASQLLPGGTVDVADAHAIIHGEGAYDQLGSSVAGGGDFDGDGLGDIVVGAPYNDDASGNAGQVLVFLGSTLAAGGTFTTAEADATFVGESAGDRAGSSVAIPGDLDGDGLDDLAAGAPGSDLGGAQAGAVYVLLSPY